MGHLENLSTTTRIESDLLVVGDNPSTKSMLMLVQGLLGIGGSLFALLIDHASMKYATSLPS